MLSDLTAVIKTEESLNDQLYWYEKTENQVMIGIGTFFMIITIIVALFFFCRYPAAL